MNGVPHTAALAMFAKSFSFLMFSLVLSVQKFVLELICYMVEKENVYLNTSWLLIDVCHTVVFTKFSWYARADACILSQTPCCIGM